MILFFDTETQMIPEGFSYKVGPEVPGHWPRLIQLAGLWITPGTLTQFDWLVRPEGWVLPPGHISGFTQEQLEAEGRPVQDILRSFDGF